MSKFATSSSSSLAAKPATDTAKSRNRVVGHRKDSGDAAARDTVRGKTLSTHSSTNSSRRSSADSQTSDGSISISRGTRLGKPSPLHQDRKKTGQVNGRDAKPVQTATPLRDSVTGRNVTSRPVSAAESRSSATNLLTRKSVESSSKPQVSGKDTPSSDKRRLKPKKPEQEIYIPRGKRMAQEKQQIEKEKTESHKVSQIEKGKTELNKVSIKPSIAHVPRVMSDQQRKLEINKSNSHVSSSSDKSNSKRSLPVQKVCGPFKATSVPKSNAQSICTKLLQKSTASRVPKQSKVSKTSHHSPVRLLDSGTDTEGSESCDEDFTFVPALQLDSHLVESMPVEDVAKECEDLSKNSITGGEKCSDQMECDERFPVSVSPNSKTADALKQADAVVTAESGATLNENVVESSVLSVVDNNDIANYVARNEAFNLQISDKMCCDVVLPDSKNDDDEEVIVVGHVQPVVTMEDLETVELTSQIHCCSNSDYEKNVRGDLAYGTDAECQPSLEYNNVEHLAVCPNSDNKSAQQDAVQCSESIVEDRFCDTLVAFDPPQTSSNISVVANKNNDLEKESSDCSEECLRDGVKIVDARHGSSSLWNTEHSSAVQDTVTTLVNIVAKYGSSSLNDGISMSTIQMQNSCETSEESVDSSYVGKEHSEGAALEIITVESSDDDDMPELVSTECDEGEVVDPDSWDALYDENGDCLDPELLAELTAAVGKVSVDFPQFDYYNWKPKGPTFDEGEHSHIVEAYDFPPEFKTEDLISVFSAFKTKGFDIKWVDDTHALIAFSSPIAAEDALRLCHPLLKTRPLSEASKEARAKARRCLEYLQPYKPRPETTAVAARRMVTGALGLKPNITREQREKERQALRDAKEKKKLIAQQRQDIWEGR